MDHTASRVMFEMLRNALIVALVLCSATARADGVATDAPTSSREVPDDRLYVREPDGIDRYGKLGIGALLRDDNHDRSVTMSLRLEVTRLIGNRFRAGGFVEASTLGFDTFDVAFGPQVQLGVFDAMDLRWGMQLRGGIGGGTEGVHGIAGVQVGSMLVGTGVAVRRSFDNQEVQVIATLEITGLVPLFVALVASEL